MPFVSCRSHDEMCVMFTCRDDITYTMPICSSDLCLLHFLEIALAKIIHPILRSYFWEDSCLLTTVQYCWISVLCNPVAPVTALSWLASSPQSCSWSISFKADSSSICHPVLPKCFSSLFMRERFFLYPLQWPVLPQSAHQEFIHSFSKCWWSSSHVAGTAMALGYVRIKTCRRHGSHGAYIWDSLIFGWTTPNLPLMAHSLYSHFHLLFFSIP